MQHTSFLFVFSFLALCTSCFDKDAGYIQDPDEPRRLVVNALWSTHDTVPGVYVYRTGALRATYCEPETYRAELTVNGQKVDTVGRNNLFDYRPQPGDHVQLSVSEGSDVAHATIDVPQPLIIEGYDTIHVNKLRSHDSKITDPFIRFQIHLRMPEGMHGMQFFRLEHDRLETHCDGYSSHYDEEQDKYVNTYAYTTDHLQDYEYDFDPALSENNTSVSDEDDEYSLEIFDEVPNNYGLFRSNFFQNGRYTLYVDVPRSYVYMSEAGYRHVFTFRVLTLPKIEFYYLWAATAICEVYEPGVLLSNPPIVPTNIQGGTGVFSIGAVAEITLDDNHLPAEAEVKDDPIYY